MKNSGFFQTLTGSFYNPETYRDVVTNKKGNSFGYLALLVLLCAIPLMISMVSGMNTFMKNEGAFIVGQVPELNISNGIVNMDKESPYYIKAKSGEPIIVIDLSDSAGITGLQGDAKVLLTKNKLIAQQKESETRTYDLSKIQNFTLNAQMIQSWFGYAWIVYVIIFIFMVIFFYIYRLIQALVNGVVGLILNAIFKVNLDFSSLLYIAMVAITPVAIIASIVWATDIQIPLKGWLGFILTLGYISFGIMANKPQILSNNSQNSVQDSSVDSSLH
jgi:hypothetical protein